MKNFAKILVVICFLFMFAMLCTNVVYADWWGDAGDWYGQGQIGEVSEAKELIDTVSNMVNIIGTTTIVIVTIFLGIKYMFGSVESKADIKQSLVTLLIACVFFFGWQSISNLLMPNNQLIFIDSNDSNYENMVGRIYATFVYIANIAAVIAVIYVGVRYIFASASSRAELKGKSVQFIIGIILAFSSINVLSYISKVVNEVIK